MPLSQRDYILRMIEQLGEALAAIAGLRKSGQLDEAAALLQTTADGVFGPLLGIVERLDATSAAALLGGRDRILAYATLTAERAAILEQQGHPARAERESRRALEIHLEAVAEMQDVDARVLERIHALADRVEPGGLSERHRSALEALRRRGALPA